MIRRHPHLVHDSVIAGVIEFAVILESRGGENGFLNLIVADAQTDFTGILIQQCFVDETVQRLLAQVFHVPFIRRQFRELIAQLLLHAVTFTRKSILKLPTADFLVVHFCGVVCTTANQVSAHAGQNERHDNDTKNNLEHETVSSRA